MDELVLRAQHFVNETYAGLIGVTVEENGETGWPTLYALTRALQYELGITALADNFGPTTLNTLRSTYPSLTGDTTPSADFTRIVQSALYCHGYDGGDIDGVWSDRVTASVTKLKQDTGVGDSEGAGLTPKLFKGLLTTDPYVLTTYGGDAGSEAVRTVQQWLNGRYVTRADYFVGACDGHTSRNLAKSLLYAAQYEIGMADGVANGNFGPGTQSGVRSHPLTEGDSGAWVTVLTAGLILNGQSVALGSEFDASVTEAVRRFQSYTALPQTGTVDFSTWASLLISYGDTARAAAACDCVTTIDAARGQALHDAGYRHVGRYLCNVAGSSLDKVIKPGELAAIADAGLGCFPIYQTYGGSASYFTFDQGYRDANDALVWARRHGFKAGTRIYFAVDFDAVDSDVTSAILPHFRAVHQVITTGSPYHVGIYGPRNVCARVSAAGYAEVSFVADMSSAFAGNVGYTLPSNWAFDQIATVTVGSGAGSVQIDRNATSGRDAGQVSFDAPSYGEVLDVEVPAADTDALKDAVRGYLESVGVPETGGGDWTDEEWQVLHGTSSTQALDDILSQDWYVTLLARRLRMRKALVQAPVLWERRRWDPSDVAADNQVLSGNWADTGTGWGQIPAADAIAARNHCVQQGIITEPLLNPDCDLHDVWTRLHEDPQYNLETAAYLMIYNASLIGLPRPGLDLSDADAQQIIARYRGTNGAAAAYGRDVSGVYQVLESFYRGERAAG